MDKNYSFYIEKNNTLFNSSVISICYMASTAEMKKYCLTNNNILILIKSKELSHFDGKKDIDYKELIASLFKEKIINLRVQCECLLGIFGDSHCDCESQRINSINYLKDHDGILIYMPQEAQGWGLHYKLKELELQVSGRLPDGKYIGAKDRDEAQSILLNNNKFDDLRSYEIIVKILNDLGIGNNQYFVLTDSDKKIKCLEASGLKIFKSSSNNNIINEDNLSEYLIKILNGTHNYEEDVINTIISLIKSRKYNDRSLATLIEIVQRIKNDDKYNLIDLYKSKFLDAYSYIICGEEKKYVINSLNKIKVQNNFSCKVTPYIFKAIKNNYGFNIFDRISLEKLYYFQNKKSDETVRIRTSKVLNVSNDNSIYYPGQYHAQERIFNKNKDRIIQSEITTSKLRSFFENPDYDYIKRVEMVTTISENVVPGLSIFIKRIPSIENRVMDIFGKKEKIYEFIDKIVANNNDILLSKVTDMNYEDENFSKYNLRFANLDCILDEELDMFNLINDKPKEN